MTHKISFILIDKLSYPGGLVVSNDFIVSKISFSIIWKMITLMFERGDNILEFFMREHINPKKSIKRLAFLWKSEINLPYTSDCAIAGILLV